ncbi:ATP-dependent Clp protease proteolytic subunit 4, chloroplastic-like [Vigna umbellata]|uniref:ATP-dependent Clp protease proteolytic subunit 4, chloroplastic-like n=1 Tax=Vigna umbellata TaxID=87088 RepID=UPI001F5E65AF|nr:ATP-dependent Clp protease proteolytic subunit 4, chloroplastic-like [Vigna umbellata]
MDLLSISPSHPSPSLRTLSQNPKLPISSFAPKPSFSFSRFSKPIKTPPRCRVSASPISSKSLNFGSDSPNPSLSFQLSAPQTPATAARGADGDVMGLLLRERIVFLGSSIDDFVADAVMSQLLLLDAQDPTKDIKLFINSTGGSLREKTDNPFLYVPFSHYLIAVR